MSVKMFYDITDNTEMYVELKGHMKDNDLYNNEDEVAIQQLAMLLVQSNLLANSIIEHGPVFETVTDNGASTMKQNPAARLHSDLQPKIRTLFDDLQLTAKSRKGDNNGAGDTVKSVKDFLNG